MNFLIWCFESTSLSRDLCKAFGELRMARESMVRQDWFISMFPPRIKFHWKGGMKVIGGFVSGGWGGLEPPAWVSGRLNGSGSFFGKSNRLQNLGSSNVLDWDIASMGWRIFEIVSMIRSSILEMRVSSSP